MAVTVKTEMGCKMEISFNPYAKSIDVKLRLKDGAYFGNHAVGAYTIVQVDELIKALQQLKEEL